MFNVDLIPELFSQYIVNIWHVNKHFWTFLEMHPKALLIYWYWSSVMYSYFLDDPPTTTSTIRLLLHEKHIFWCLSLKPSARLAKHSLTVAHIWWFTLDGAIAFQYTLFNNNLFVCTRVWLGMTEEHFPVQAWNFNLVLSLHHIRAACCIGVFCSMSSLKIHMMCNILCTG